jgi:hypothetical protein
LERPSPSLQNKELDCPEKPKHLRGLECTREAFL